MLGVQMLRYADLSSPPLEIQLLSEGLPWGKDSEGNEQLWPLSAAQRKWLSFELLLLSRLAASEDEERAAAATAAASEAAKSGESQQPQQAQQPAAAVQLLAIREQIGAPAVSRLLAGGLVERLCLDADAPPEEDLLSALETPEAWPSPRATAESQPAKPAKITREASRGLPAALLEFPSTASVEQLGALLVDDMGALAGAAREDFDGFIQSGGVATLAADVFGTVEASATATVNKAATFVAGGDEEVEEGASTPWLRSSALLALRRLFGAELSMTDAEAAEAEASRESEAMREVRLSLGIGRTEAARLARAVRLELLGQGARFGDMAPFVPFRLLLLQFLRPESFRRANEVKRWGKKRALRSQRESQRDRSERSIREPERPTRRE